MMKKPFKTYFGGKEAPGVYQTIINHIRPHLYFAEPFGGNFTISRKMNGGSAIFINELDPRVFRKYDTNQAYRIRFSNLDYREFLTNFFKETESLFRKVIYFDPPYPLYSRKSSKKVYKYEFADKDHMAFLDYVISVQGMADILISTYPNELYRGMLKDWTLVEFDGMDRHGKTTEWLFFNYALEDITELHDHQYYGSNFTERQRISRSISNTVRKIIQHKDPIIRNAIISEIRNSL